MVIYSNRIYIYILIMEICISSYIDIRAWIRSIMLLLSSY